ncbi:MAG: hypothetical protein ACFCU8_13435 [Thermosynechococcaceae cyanobacterium]
MKTNTLSVLAAIIVGGTAAFLLTQLSVQVESTVSSPRITPLPAPSIATQPLPDQPAKVLDQLRVSNRTRYPIRLVLLTRAAASTEPIHWDFAPIEGHREGLVLSRPAGQLRLKKGDVLTAFALDGSRRYWGPYIVGETVQPSQSSPTAEWQLVLTP